jgi:periplasmic divalent cation tolerance protein
MISIYVTCPSRGEAGKIARHLLSRKLAACASIFPVESVFRWNGRTRNKKEAAMLLKASKGDYKKIESEIKKMHSYEVPCIVAFKWENASPEYKSWVMKNS